jgi:hypothetical protein
MYPAGNVSRVFYFYLLDYCDLRIPYTQSLFVQFALFAGAAPSGASRVPPPIPSCRAARRSPLPVAGGSRAGATTRRARPRRSGLKRARPAVASVRTHGTTTRGAPPPTRNTEPIHAAKAQKRERAASTPARGANPRAPLSSGGRSNAARGAGGGRRGTGGRFLPPNCSRRSAKIQKVWLSCVAR